MRTFTVYFLLVLFYSCEAEKVNNSAPVLPNPNNDITTTTPVFDIIASKSITEPSVVAVSPAFPKETDKITIRFNAFKGDMGLKGNSTDVYAWTGVITNLSSSGSDWKHVKSSSWNSPDPNAKLTKIKDDVYEISFVPKDFYSLSSGEIIKKIAILFKTGDGSKSGRNVDGSDIYINIYPATGLYARLMSPAISTFYNTRELETKSVKSTDTLRVIGLASKVSQITIKFNDKALISKTDSLVEVKIYSKVAGSNKIKLTASADGVDVSEEFEFFVPTVAVTEELPSTNLSDGVNFSNNGTSVTFVLNAPNLTNVNLIGDFNNWAVKDEYTMKKTSAGKWWITVDNLTAGKPYSYQYYINYTSKVADPYSTLVLDPDNDKYIPSTVYSPDLTYPSNASGIVSYFKSNETSYSWNVNTFTRPAKEKLVIYEMLIRDFVTERSFDAAKLKIPYLKNLGINAIELMPVTEFEGNESWGYNISYPLALDKYYGNKNALKTFVDECHKNGIAVILDAVLNHLFGQSSFVKIHLDETNGPVNKVAKHDYNVGYDLNHEHAITKAYTKDFIKYWINEFKIDGFRFDLSKGFTQRNTLGNVNEWGLRDDSRIAIWKDYIDYIKSVDNDFIIILEHFANDDEQSILASYGAYLWNNMNGYFSNLSKGQSQSLNGGLFKNRSMTTPNLINFMESHDEERIMVNSTESTLTNKLKSVVSMFPILIGFPGPNMLWQFGELGFDNSINSGGGRLSNKNPVWEYENVAERKAMRDSISRIIKFKTQLNIFNSTPTNITYELNNQPKYIKFEADNKEILIISNSSNVSATTKVSIKNAGLWFEYMSSKPRPMTFTVGENSITLDGYEYHIYLK